MAGPLQALPPGVYFNPSAEECVRDFLRPWIAGVRPGTDRIIDDVDIYSEHPAALVRGREPGLSRGFEHKWFLLTHCVCLSGGRGRGKVRVKRDVATGGNWRVEQRTKNITESDQEEEPPGGDRRRTNGFYLGGGKGKGRNDGAFKTPWLMEELTTEEEEAAAAGGWRGERIVKVFCKLYVSPRASNDDKLEIFGEDRVSFDRLGKPKALRAPLPEQLFDAFADNVYKAVGQGPPPPSPRVLGHQQGQPARHVLGHQQGQPAAVPRVLGLQQGQPAPPPPLRVQYAPTPDILRHHYGHAVMPPGVPAHHHGHGGPHPGFLGYQCGQAAPRQIQGVAMQPQRRYVLDPYHHFQEPSPGVAGYYSHQDTVVYYYPTPSFVRLDPQQGEEMARMEKKPRLAYGGSPPGSEMSSCVVQASTSQGQCGDTDADAKVFQEPEPVPAPSPPPPQEIPGTGTAQPELDDDDAGKAAVELMPESDFMDLPDLFDLDDVPDYVMPQGMFKPPSDKEPPPQPDFDEFVKPPSDEEPPPQPDFDEFVKPPSDEEPPPQPDFNEFVKPPSDEFVKPPSDDEPQPQPDFDLFSWEDFMKDAPDFLTAARSPGQT